MRALMWIKYAIGALGSLGAVAWTVACIVSGGDPTTGLLFLLGFGVDLDLTAMLWEMYEKERAGDPT